VARLSLPFGVILPFVTTSTKIIFQLCEELSIPCTFIDPDGFALCLSINGQNHFVVNNTFGLTSNVDARLAVDKAFQYHLLKDLQLIPFTQSYLDPHSKYVSLKKMNIKEIVKDIETQFSVPFILKRNSGCEGSHVFKIEQKEDLLPQLQNIFDQHSSEYDPIAIAQQYIQPQHEYRVMILNGKIELVYEKTFQEITETLTSQRRWEAITAKLITDSEKILQLQQVVNKILVVWPIAYAGLDVIEDREGKIWLIEVNSAPALAYFIRDNGPELVKQLYKKILLLLAQ
jgi:hypothetical protein